MYECAVILAPTLNHEALENAAKKFTGVIAAHGGTVTNVDDWGKRSLAYEIKFHREGFYHFYRFEGTGETLNELNRQLRIDENVIRHMIVVYESEPVPPPREPEEEPEPSRDAD